MSGGSTEETAGAPGGAGVPEGSSGQAQLVRAAQGGDRQAFDRLVRAHFGRIYSLLFRLVGNHEDAEDLAQECFVRAWSALRFYRGEGSFEGWLLRIAVHLARDASRKRARSGELIGLEDVGVAGGEVPAGTSRSDSGGLGTRAEQPGQEAGQREMMRGLEVSIASLPENLRVSLVLRVLEGLEYEDVARATGVRPATVRMRVMKARRLLMRQMKPWLDGGEL